MKIVFLDVKTIGEDIDLSAYDALGEVVKYGFSTSEEVPERAKDADVLIINKDNWKCRAFKISLRNSYRNKQSG